MPRPIEGTVGWLALKLRASQLQQQQAIEADKIQWERETESRAQAQVPAIIQAGLQDQRLREMSTEKADQSLRIAEMNNATRLAINEQTNTLRKMLGERGLDLKDKSITVNDENTDAKLAQENQIAANKLEQDKQEELGRNTRNTETVTGRLAGIQDNVHGGYRYDIPPPAGVTQAAPPEPGALTKKSRQDLTSKVTQQQDQKAAIDDVGDMLDEKKHPGIRRHFGLVGGTGIGPVNANSAQNIYSLIGSAVKQKTGAELPGADQAQKDVIERNAIKSRILDYLVPKLKDESGATVTDSEAQRQLNEMGIAINPDGSVDSSRFNPFSQDYDVAIAAIRQLSATLDKAAGRNVQRLERGNVILPPGNGTQQPTTQTPVQDNGSYAKDLQEAKKRVAAGKISKEMAAKILGNEYGEKFNPGDLE